ncbi:MAG TPA: siphovirus ReqiPepy6 Gp37-like family protein [Actinophytocola sp.]|uniref:siphovirus ReqiPepy6 Gp37-like family protein n=1 Tax=Actinophytocola sp. TaxID=1872138 RepID=UPI002DBF0AA3|nr:siphovirus ReqiPepy6 Gp37-like family protein [Actinophytocola sp.]HEU5475719.1 siphovirus ReqiPepy6 Gp37-like family protein [Actinophytocola sp.]
MADTVWMIDPTGATRGTIMWSSYTAVPKFNDVGTWQVNCPLTPQHALAAAAGWRVAIMAGTSTVIAGPVTKAEIKIDGTSGRATRRLVLSGEDDMRWMRGRDARPAPLAALSAQTPAYDIRTGVASTIMRQYVDVNAGPGALVARRVPSLTLAADPVAGPSITGRARFDKLLPLLQGLAVSGAVAGVTLGFRVNSGFGLGKVFQVYLPADLTGPARFSMALRNLKMLTWTLTAPTATHIVGGGRGEEDARDFIEVADTADATAWGRLEDFYDFRAASDSDSNVELTQGAQKRLDEQGHTQLVEVVPVDTARLQYGRDYGLGDVITVDVYGGVTVDEVVREVEIKVDRAGGRKVTPRVGTVGATRSAASWIRLRDALARISNLERR